MRRKWEIRKARNGRGLFGTKRIAPGELIATIRGRRVSAEEVWHVGGALSDNAFRYGPETYLDPGHGPGRWLNHSCEPNAAVGKKGHRLFLFASSTIRAGEEIVIDYSTILGGDDIWTMKCACGAGACRGRVRNLARIPGRLREEYITRRMVPAFIIRTLNSG